MSKLRDNLRSEQHVVLEFAIAVFRGVFRPQQMATLLVGDGGGRGGGSGRGCWGHRARALRSKIFDKRHRVGSNRGY